MNNEEYINEDDEIWTLSPWGCLTVILKDYNIDTSHIKGYIGTHIVEDFMDLMVKCGHVSIKDEE